MNSRCSRVHVFLGAAVIALQFSVAVPAAADPWSDAVAAYERGDFRAALSIFQTLAEQGHARAQSTLGLMYTNGEGAPQDYAEAVKWLRKAAEQGEGHAQNDLGVMYSKGNGVPQDYAEAVKWYRKAAEQGFGYAQTSLGAKFTNQVQHWYTPELLWEDTIHSSI